VAREGIPRWCFCEVLVRRKMFGGSVHFCARDSMVSVFYFCRVLCALSNLCSWQDVGHRIGHIWRVGFDLFGIVMSHGDHRSEHIWGGGCSKCVYDHRRS